MDYCCCCYGRVEQRVMNNTYYRTWRFNNNNNTAFDVQRRGFKVDACGRLSRKSTTCARVYCGIFLTDRGYYIYIFLISENKTKDDTDRNLYDFPLERTSRDLSHPRSPLFGRQWHTYNHCYYHISSNSPTIGQGTVTKSFGPFGTITSVYLRDIVRGEGNGYIRTPHDFSATPSITFRLIFIHGLRIGVKRFDATLQSKYFSSQFSRLK